ncbi:winged helix-turn-helix domain-containing protein [[Clostridium] scindens]
MKITHSEKLIFRGLEVDQLQRRVTRADVVVELTKYEYDLLLYLASSPNRVFTTEQIYQHIYEDVEAEVNNRVYGLVKNLRKKIEDKPEAPRYIETIRGVGYRFRA